MQAKQFTLHCIPNHTENRDFSALALVRDEMANHYTHLNQQKKNLCCL